MQATQQHQSTQQSQTLSQTPALRDLTQKFTAKGWTITKDKPNKVEFQSPTSVYDAFEIEIDRTNISVTIPLKTSRYKYFTKFTDYFSACEFVEMHLDEY